MQQQLHVNPKDVFIRRHNAVPCKSEKKTTLNIVSMIP